MQKIFVEIKMATGDGFLTEADGDAAMLVLRREPCLKGPLQASSQIVDAGIMSQIAIDAMADDIHLSALIEADGSAATGHGFSQREPKRLVV